MMYVWYGGLDEVRFSSLRLDYDGFKIDKACIEEREGVKKQNNR